MFLALLFACAAAAHVIEEHAITLSTSGLTIEYATSGRSNRPVVIALHGYTDSWYSYKLLMEESDQLNFYSLSLPCFGDSTKDVSVASSYDSLAAVIVEFMDELGIDQAYIMGHSMSSPLAPHIAYLYPLRVLGVILVGPRATFVTDPSMVGPEGFFAYVEASIEQYQLGPEDFFGYQYCYDWQMSTVYAPVSYDFISQCIQETMKVPVKCWRAGIQAMGSSDFTSTLSSIHAPILIIYGDHEMFPWDKEIGGQESLIVNLPGSTLTVQKMKEIGHASHWESPELVMQYMLQFIQHL